MKIFGDHPNVRHFIFFFFQPSACFFDLLKEKFGPVGASMGMVGLLPPAFPGNIEVEKWSCVVVFSLFAHLYMPPCSSFFFTDPKTS